MTGRDREKLRDDVRVEQEVENPSSENKVHYVQKANRSTSNHNILAAHLYPVGEFRDAAGGVIPGFLEHSQQLVRLRNVDLLHQYGDIAPRQHKRIRLSHRPRGL